MNTTSYSLVQWGVVQLELRRQHVARPSVVSGPRKDSEKIFTSEIRWKACEVTFVSLNLLALDKLHLHKKNE